MSSAVARYFPLADQFVGRHLNCIDYLSVSLSAFRKNSFSFGWPYSFHRSMCRKI
jgi:hypothetical protein